MKELDTDFYLTGGTALSRAYYNHRFSFEPKDIADIWVIAKNNSFNWKDILKKAKCKDAVVTEEAATGITRSFPSKYLNKMIALHKHDFLNHTRKISKLLFSAGGHIGPPLHQ